ncbi:TetR/AcrR family transcriptional regulator [Mycobacterium sp. ACS4331]|uniref:TetR/AcrR family transcriptional regulator n=1 Tax=Mycobacterium sp. ACS4331 TaxID=1834121 RepID=UPI0007FD28AA|nr:TetR/AcrR family transcriptional regulator [Mycobacterium sp. ACS4331]OBF22567.1 transcriptional regulator [Mycobacterium sp. ACS4331]
MSLRRAGARAEHLGPQRRRPQVLDTALDIAAEEGLTQVTFANIAARMGVSRPVVYDCYRTRGDILAALLERETEVSLSRLTAILPPLKTGSVEEMFVEGFRSLLSDVQERPASWRIIFTDDPDPALTEAISGGRRHLTEHTAAVMRPLFERWQVADLDRVLPVLTEVFLGICETSVATMLAPESTWAPDELADIVGRAAYRALRARS